MSTLTITYDAQQHALARLEPSGHEVAVDAGTGNGGQGGQLSPADMLGTALSSCMLFTMGWVAMRSGLELTGTTVSVEVTMTEEPKLKVGAIHLAFNLPATIPAGNRFVLERAARACPIHQSLDEDVSVTQEFRYEQ